MNDNYSPLGYTTVRYDDITTDRRSPFGLVIFIKEYLNFTRCLTFRNANFEVLLVQIVHPGKSVDIAVMYCKPNSSLFDLFEGIYTLRKYLVPGKPTIVLGDLNIDLSRDINSQNNINKVCHILGLNQMIRNPTTNRNTIIDFCFTNLNLDTSIIFCQWSYHNSIVGSYF